MKRIRVVFDEGRLLSKDQRSWGMRRCWLLIKPEIATVADLASDLFHRFHLQRNCPDGIFFKMDGFVIPPCESTSFFREKDIVSVHKRTCKKKKLITRGDDMQLISRGEIVEKEAVPCSNGMLTIESRERIEMRNNQVMREGNSSLQTQLAEMGSKRKHKEIEKSDSSKKKKPKLTTIQKPLVINGSSYKETQEEPNQQCFQRARTSEQNLHEKANPSAVDEAFPMKLTTIQKPLVINGSNYKETQEEPNQQCFQRARTSEQNLHEKANPSAVDEAFPMKLTTIQKPLVINGSNYKETQEEPNQQCFQRARTSEQNLHEKANPSAVDEASPMVVLATENANVSNDTSQTIPERNKQLEENCNANTCEPDSGNLTKKLPSRSARRKFAQRLLKKEMKKQAAEKMQSAVLLNGTDELATENHVAPGQESTVTSNLIVARVDRPGHIRFESEGEDDNDDDDDAGPSKLQLKEPPMESFQWNGIANKVMGQKWGQGFKHRYNASRYNSASSNWKDATNEDSFTNEKVTEKSTSNKGKAITLELNFESLSPLTRSPKIGDLIAYRVVELSSTWCPDLSPFRVGEVKVYDLMSNRIILIPVPEYPIFSDSKGDDANEGEEDAPYQDNLSLYKEDGSLEIEFTSLVDVRLLRINGSVSPSASSVSRKTNSSQAAMKKDKFLVNRSEMAVGKSSADDVVDPTRTQGSQDAEKNLFSKNNRDFAVQNGAEEPIPEPTGTEPNCNCNFNGEVENAGNTQAQQNGWDMQAEKSSAHDLVKPTSIDGSQHADNNLFSEKNWDVAVQNDPEEPLHDPTGTEPNYNWEVNCEVENGENTQSHENGWDTWTPNTSTPSWSYRALRGSALGPTIAWLRGNNGNATSGDSNAIRWYGGDGGRSRGRGRGRGRGRRGRGRGNYGMLS